MAETSADTGDAAATASATAVSVGRDDGASNKEGELAPLSRPARGARPAGVDAALAIELELERALVPALRALRDETRRQRQRPLLLVDGPALSRALLALQAPFGAALALRHVLAPAAAEAFEEAASLALAARRTGSIAGHALFAGPPPLLPWLRARLDARAREFALLPPRRSRVLLKLLALRALVGGRVIRPHHIPGVNDSLFLATEAAAARQGVLARNEARAAAARAALDDERDRDDDEAFERALDAAVGEVS